jgi:cell division protein FtsB
MSTNPFVKKVLSLVLIIVVFSLAISSLRHVIVYYRVQRKTAEKEKEIKILEEKNMALKVRLQEVQSPKFLDEEARKLLGVGDASGAAEITFDPIITRAVEIPKEPSNPKKWLNFFGF